MANIYSVVQISNYIKNMFDSDFVLENVSVSGEVSNCKYHSSGHIYFALKDKNATLSAVMFAGNRTTGLKFKMTDGMQVVVTGKISVYEASGKYQIYARSIKQDGHGELYERYLLLKKELEEMGMFDKSYKKDIPTNIKKLGIVTASTGAAVQDIINIATRRNPYIQLVLYPAKVQGEGAAESICKGIEILDSYGVDVIIAGRGGGSIEDLWAFNEETVARAVFNCNTPIISAVGHETDFTIIDFVSDLRAPTPSAAAELAVTDIFEVMDSLEYRRDTLVAAMSRKLQEYRKMTEGYSVRLKYLSPENTLNNKRMQLDEISDRLNMYMDRILMMKKHTFSMLCARLKAASPLTRLESGYSYIVGEAGKPLTSVTDVKEDELVDIYLKDGNISARIENITVRQRG